MRNYSTAAELLAVDSDQSLKFALIPDIIQYGTAFALIPDIIQYGTAMKSKNCNLRHLLMGRNPRGRGVA